MISLVSNWWIHGQWQGLGSAVSRFLLVEEGVSRFLSWANCSDFSRFLLFADCSNFSRFLLFAVCNNFPFSFV